MIQFPVRLSDTPPCEIVPLAAIVMLPDTVVLLLIVSVEAFVPPMISDLQIAVADIVGWLAPVKLASPIMTSIVDVGTPNVQLLGLLQAVLIVPFQLV